MNRGQIRQRILNDIEVDTTEITSAVVNGWIQDCDNAIQLWRPEEIGLKMTFDYWDFLKEIKNWVTTTASQEVFTLPDNYRGFIELRVGTDTTPYKVVDYSNRSKFTDHVCWIIGKKLYIPANSNPAGTTVSMVFIHISDEFISDADEPEIESAYHTAYVEYGKARFYNQQQDSDMEKKNMDNFNNWMIRKKNDQEIARMQGNLGGLSVSQSFLV